MLKKNWILKLMPFWGILLILNGCIDLLEPKFDPYARPDWLEGKVYTQIKAQPDLSLFAKCMELTGYDTIVDISGSYTVFAPVNEAIDIWLGESQYASLEEVPVSELERIVSYHLVQNPWSKLQLKSVDIYGWIDTLDKTNDKPLGYKRITYLQEEDGRFNVKMTNDLVQIVEDGSTSWKRRVINNTRKYVPVFYKSLFDYYNLKSADYEYYFDRPFEGGEEIYYANGKIKGEEINAENGFIYPIDEVVVPLRTAYDILNQGTVDYKYDKFLSIVNEFTEFEFNLEKTNQQPGAAEGLIVDSLFDLTYPELVFNIYNENTSAPSSEVNYLPENVTTRYQHGLLVPTNQAFDELVSTYIQFPGGWLDLHKTPRHIKRIIANSYMSVNAIYPTDFATGIINGENDIIELSESDIVYKEYASNSTVIGLDNYIVPRAFSSVTGPIYLQKDFLTVMSAIEKAKILQALKRKNQDYMLFVESDASLAIDSSLIYDEIFDKFYAISLVPSVTKNNVLVNDLRNLLLNHVAIHQPNGIARKEFIPNLLGNYIIVNNETGEISGNSPTTIGYNGLTVAPDFPVKLELAQPTDNGTTYKIENWFSFSANNLYNQIKLNYPDFYNLLKRVNLVNDREYKLTLISPTNLYTIFAPTNVAIQASQIDTLSNEELKKALLLHFIQGELIFTDGNKPSGYYETLRIDEEQSNEYRTVNSDIYVETDYDLIGIQGKDGLNYLEVAESANANQLTGYIIEDKQAIVYTNVFTNAVVHSVDKVLIFNDLNTK